MKTFLMILLSLFVLGGCSYKINPQSINSDILPKQSTDVKKFLISKTYSTYSKEQEKITIYFFKIKDDALHVSDMIEYIPYDYTNQLYDIFSSVTFTLRNLTNNTAKTLEAALDNEAAKHNYTLLFTDKDEVIIGNDFAREILFAIREFNEKIQRQENREMRRENFLLL